MGRTTKIIGFSVPPAIAEEVKRVAKEEKRTKSELFREMFRVYESYRKKRDQEYDQWVMDIIREAEEEKKKPMTKEEIEQEAQEEERLLRYGAQRAKKMGIALEDVDRIIHEERAKRRKNRA